MPENTNERGGAKGRKKVTVRQQQAIEVLLIGGTDQQAAEKAEVSRSTVTKWRNNPASAFAEELERAREEMRKRQNARILAAGSLAVRALEDGVKDTRSPSARISAARTIMDQGSKANESEELETSKLEIILNRLKVGLDRFEYERALQALLEEPSGGSGAKRYPRLKRLAERELEALRREPVPEGLRLLQSGGVIALPVKEMDPASDPLPIASGITED